MTSSDPAAVLVFGSPRSGTTMVAELLNRSDRMAVMFEYGLGALIRDMGGVWRYGREEDARIARMRRGDRPRSSATTYGAAVVRPHSRRFPHPERFRAVAAAVVAAALGKTDVAYVGSKTPGPVASRDVRLVHEMFDDVRHIVVVRNPIDVVNSTLNRRNLARLGMDEWPVRDVDDAIEAYRRGALDALSLVARAPERTFVFPFDAYARDAEPVLDALSTFLGVRVSADAHTRARDHNRRTILTSDEEARARRAFGAAIDAWDRIPLTGMRPAGLTDALADVLEPVEAGRRYAYDDGALRRTFLGRGWSESDATGVWSDDDRADLFFPVPPGRAYRLQLDAGFFVPRHDSALTVAVEHDGAEILRETITGAGAARRTLVTRPFAATSRIACVSLRIEGASSPLAAGMSGDDRLLGVFAYGVTLDAA